VEVVVEVGDLEMEVEGVDGKDLQLLLQEQEEVLALILHVLHSQIFLM
jgi:hypothetical protein